MTDPYQVLEGRRLKLQAELDAGTTATERNKLGQFATPTMLASDILTYARSLLPPTSPVRFLDPAFGTGSFYSALCRAMPQDRIDKVLAYEIDIRYAAPTAQLWQNSHFHLRVADFTRAAPPVHEEEKANLIICNPPYVRHHHLSAGDKTYLQFQAKQVTGITLSKLAGLYCYFLLISHAWLSRDGVAGWLIPSEFMDVRYGHQVKQYLTEHVTLLRVHRFEPSDMQFADALVSSAVIWFKAGAPPEEHEIDFTYGGTHMSPHIAKHIPLRALKETPKWTSLPVSRARKRTSSNNTTLADLFTIKRGLATGDNKFFILTPEQIEAYEIPRQFLIPILPSARYLRCDIIDADGDGNPVLDHKLFLVACALPEAQVRDEYPSLWRYLQRGIKEGVHETYLCRHRQPWYAQEQRPPAPFLCTYMGRRSSDSGNPFRFILNRSLATAANSYHVLYPKPAVTVALANDPVRFREVWKALNAIAPETMIGEGRVYGGGLHKVEPKELGNIPAHSILALLSEFGAYQGDLMTSSGGISSLVAPIYQPAK